MDNNDIKRDLTEASSSMKPSKDEIRKREIREGKQTVKNDDKKRIFVFYDGTWCGDITGTYTNIKRLADTVAGGKLGERRLENEVRARDGSYISHKGPNGTLIYYRGVGLNEESIVNYLVNGAISLEIKEDVIKAYKFIVDNYELNTEIWMFGLSRGAYIVRSVAGLINNCGILKKSKFQDIPVDRRDESIKESCEEFYEYYKNRDDDYKPDKMRDRLKNICHETNKPPIKFMGLIDTVGALGIPRIDPERGTSYEFYNQNVSSEVENVYQAVAIHDRLGPFTPCFIKRDEKKINKHGKYIGWRYKGVKVLKYQTKEVWFPGAHYDLADQYFTFGLSFEAEDLTKIVDDLESKLELIVSEKEDKKARKWWDIHGKVSDTGASASDELNTFFVLNSFNYELGKIMEKTLLHYWRIAKSIKIEPNRTCAENVYDWMIKKIEEIKVETDSSVTIGSNIKDIIKRDRTPHTGSDVLEGEVYERLLVKFGFPFSYLKDIILKDRVINPWTGAVRTNTNRPPTSNAFGYERYESETLDSYLLIRSRLENTSVSELFARIEVPMEQ